MTYPMGWIRIAGNAERIRMAENAHWRCFLDAQGVEMPLEDWALEGTATRENVVPGTNPQRDALGLIAWIDVYGTLTVGDDMRALVVLSTPEGSPPPGRWNQ